MADGEGPEDELVVKEKPLFDPETNNDSDDDDLDTVSTAGGGYDDGSISTSKGTKQVGDDGGIGTAPTELGGDGPISSSRSSSSGSGGSKQVGDDGDNLNGQGRSDDASSELGVHDRPLLDPEVHNSYDDDGGVSDEGGGGELDYEPMDMGVGDSGDGVQPLVTEDIRTSARIVNYDRKRKYMYV